MRIVFPVGETAVAAGKIRSADIETLSRAARENLPAPYTLAAFEEAWFDAMRDCVEMPVRRGNLDTQMLLSPGRVARLRLGLTMTARLRTMFGKSYLPGDPGAEWPH